MSRSGVRPLGERGARPAAAPKKTLPPPPAPAAKGVATAAPMPPAPTPVRPSAPVSARDAARAEDLRTELWSELERLRSELKDRSQQLHDAQAEASAARVALEDAQDLSRRLSTELRQVVADRQGLRDALAAVTADREEIAHHRRTLQQSLEQLRAEAPSPRQDARALLEARGLVGDSEVDRLLRAVGELHEGAALISSLDVADPERLELWLEDRVALVCGNCPTAPGRAVLQVPPPRCDVCGGSDIKRAVKRFQDAALLSGLGRIVIVGGSPQYHRQLRALVTEPRISLNLVPGDRRRTLKQVAADEAGADLVIVWGATLLDHSLSQLYGRNGGRILRIPQRGIGRMLDRATEGLTREGP